MQQRRHDCNRLIAHIYMYIYTHTYICVHIYKYKSIHIYIRAHTCNSEGMIATDLERILVIEIQGDAQPLVLFAGTPQEAQKYVKRMCVYIHVCVCIRRMLHARVCACVSDVQPLILFAGINSLRRNSAGGSKVRKIYVCVCMYPYHVCVCTYMYVCLCVNRMCVRT